MTISRIISVVCAVSIAVGGAATTPAAAMVPDSGSPLPPAATTPHRHAPNPQPFAPDQIARWYLSDLPARGPFYYPIVSGFERLRQDHPEVLADNLEQAVTLNNSAVKDPIRVQRALADDHDDLLVTMSDAWGTELSGHFRQALAQHRLPQVEQLLSGVVARGGGIASSTGAEKYWFNYPRLFVVAPDRIVRVHREGADDEYSTTPSFPSGHTAQAAWKGAVLAYMIPEFGAQMLARAAEVGDNRIALGVHYPLDVIGGRMVGLAAAADRLNDPEFRALIDAAATQLRTELEWRCSASLVECARRGEAYADDATAVARYTHALTYGFWAIGARDEAPDVPVGAEVLLSSRFPDSAGYTVGSRVALLAATSGASGYPLDETGRGGSWQRLNLAAAWASPGVS
ncbi:acid phosphatase [Corynebacterium uberis]|uniref:acid phosphatase n=1 Tax=Corynebacterium TaxID=1716 RepID=UPI001D0A8CA9|nr:phosphatase PAP2 family protein [Corynebacterium uberis]MCZ9308226.1 phosphatase PAP2 family protein [Corynebacterium sp. c6VSa_13]UDL73906.1 phosphatase PAP2 family protein [Corynebacterium uberis]UDL75211.1 phosphatase PAP2 family protein [Corynebacterium uberis]UDL77422.1 phosphatase PAP2 family protein [Corynebacterium uberis]UDL79707.1 phosphatase PAP2 family protein [Corynebacterium uberis]